MRWPSWGPGVPPAAPATAAKAETEADASGGQIARQIAKILAKEIGSAATDEAKDLGLAATHKARELGQRRRDRRAAKHNATEAALRKAEELGLDVEDVEGTGAEGRVTVHDVEKAAVV